MLKFTIFFIIVFTTNLKRLTTGKQKLQRQYKKQFQQFLDIFQKQNNKQFQKHKPRILEDVPIDEQQEAQAVDDLSNIEPGTEDVPVEDIEDTTDPNTDTKTETNTETEQQEVIHPIEEENLKDGLKIGNNSFFNNIGYIAGGSALLLSQIAAYFQRNSSIYGLRKELNGERMAFENIYTGKIRQMTMILEDSGAQLDSVIEEMDMARNQAMQMIQSEIDNISINGQLNQDPKNDLK